MAEPFSFFGNTTLNEPKEDYTNALLGKKPKENAFASPQVNPMMAQTQILGQAPVAQASGGAAMVGEPQVFQGLPWGPQEPGTLRAELGTAPAPAAPVPVVQPQVTQEPQKPSFFESGGFGYEYLGGRLGENVGEFLGKQLHGTGRSAEGYTTGHPLERGTLLGDTANLGGYALHGAGELIVDPLVESGKIAKSAFDYVVGNNGVEAQREEAAKLEEEKAARRTAAGEKNAINPFASPDPDPVPTMGLSQQGIADALARTKAGGEEDLADPNSPQANFLREKKRMFGKLTNDQIAQATRYAASIGAAFDPETGYSRDAFLAGEPAPRPNNLTTVGGTPLNEFLSGAAIPDQGFAGAENAMYGDNSLSRGLGGDVATKAFQDASEAREARLGARPDFGQAFGGMSETTSAGLTEGDYRNILREQGVTGSAQNAMAKQMMSEQMIADDAANAPVAPKPLTESERLAREQFDYKKTQDAAQKSIDAYNKAIENAETAEEKAKIKNEMETKERDLYSMHQDGFERQERYIEQALKNTGKMSTGKGSIFKFVPGSKASDLNESLKPILGEAAFGRLQQMRDASKTGGALGAISERELDLLQSAMGALNSSQSESQFRSNLLAYRKQLRESNKRMKEAYNAQFGNGQAGSGQAGGSASPRYSNDQDAGGSIDDILLPKSK